jgi:phosphoribosylanthranilate isomerase
LKVKICGITNLEDALLSIEAGADALGFLFYEKSPRYISPEKAKDIISKLPPFVEKVGLFVNESVENIDEIAKKSGITLAQLHFEIEDVSDLKTPYIRVIRASKREDILKFENEYRIVDAFVEEYGGMGKRIDISWFDGIDTSKVILAGGLSSENVSEVKDLGFYALDISSGVEERKGKKSKEKVFEFIRKAKS